MLTPGKRPSRQPLARGSRIGLPDVESGRLLVPLDVIRAEVGGVPDVAVPAGDGLVEAVPAHLLDHPVLARVQVHLPEANIST